MSTGPNFFFQEFGGHRLRLHLQEAVGSGSAAIFLHHGLGAIDAWQDLPGVLGGVAPGGRVLVYERWGYGGSAARERFAPGFMEAEVPVLEEIVESLAIRPVHLIGHSDGASITLLFAAACPDLVGSVVSIAAHTFVETATTRSIRALLAGANSGNLPPWLTRQHGARAETLLRAWADVWLGDEHGSWNITIKLAGVRCPVLALQGSADEFGSLEQLRSIESGVAGAEGWLVDGAGYSPHFDQREAFVERVAAFWG